MINLIELKKDYVHINNDEYYAIPDIVIMENSIDYHVEMFIPETDINIYIAKKEILICYEVNISTMGIYNTLYDTISGKYKILFNWENADFSTFMYHYENNKLTIKISKKLA